MAASVTSHTHDRPPDVRRPSPSDAVVRWEEAPVPSPEKTGRLVELARAGNRGAFAQLLIGYRNRLVGMARKKLGRAVREHVESEDVAQDVMAEVVLRFSRCVFHNEKEFTSWLTRILCNRIRKEARRASLARASVVESGARFLSFRVSTSETPSQHLMRRESLEGLESAMRALPLRQQAVIRLRDIEGLDYALVARELGLRTTAAARMLRRRAWVALTEKLEKAANGEVKRRTITGR